MRTVVGVFPSRVEAEHAAQDLEVLGIPNDDVKIATAVDTEKGERSERNYAAAGTSGFGWIAAPLIHKASKRTRAQAVVMAALFGGALGLAAGLIALTLHSGAPLVIGDEAGTVITCIGIGAIGAAALAWFYRSGVSHEALPLAEEAAREHGIVLSAHVNDLATEEALRVLRENGASKLRAGADAWAASGSKEDHTGEAPYPSESDLRGQQYRDY